MELVLKTPIEELIPKLISFNNEEIMNWVKPQLENYKNIVYTSEQLSQAKSDRATLNKLKTAMEDERKRIKKLYLEPYNNFEKQIKEITNLIDETSIVIDEQVKSFEEEKKAKKRTEIAEFWESQIGELENLVSLEKVFNEQWLNTTYSMTKVREDITNFITKTNQDIAVLSSLNFKDDKYLKDFYFKTFDLALTLGEKTRLEEQEKKLEELEKLKAKEQKEQVQEETKQEEQIVLDFRIWATNSQIQALKEFLTINKIKYGRVPTKGENNNE